MPGQVLEKDCPINQFMGFLLKTKIKQQAQIISSL